MCRVFLIENTLHMTKIWSCRGKFSHSQGVLKRKPIHMAEFRTVLLDWENPGYGKDRRKSCRRLEFF